MLFMKKIKAGVLLYAILIAAIFSLFLQFYLNRLVATERQNQAQLSASKAYLIADLTQDLAKEESGQLTFNYGESRYHKQNGQLLIEVHLTNEQSYQYHFNCVMEGDKEKKEITTDDKTPAKSKVKGHS